MEYKKPFISDEEGKELRERFTKIYKELILPAYPGADKLLQWIEKSDFFEAPASTMYHLSCKYGLVKHSLNVYDRLKQLISLEYGEKFEDALGVDNSEVALIALLHDICKAQTYIVETRNVKDSSGNWVKEPYYKYSPQFEYGHGEKSVYIIQSFIQNLTLNVCLSIRYHMGAAGNGGSPYRDDNALKEMENFPIILLTNTADMWATYLNEAREPKE